MNRIDIAIILTDAQKKIIWINEGFTSMTGYSLPDVLGKSPASLVQGPETEPEKIEHIREKLKDEKPVKEFITNYKKNREKYLCELVIHPIHDSNGQLVNFIAFEVDRTQLGDNTSPIPLLQLNAKYQTSSLDKVKELKLFDRLQNLMVEDQVFLRSDLSLKEVAALLDTNTKYLSQVINVQAQSNFHRFINQYRVDYVKDKMLDPALRHLTLHGIALQCGFSSKSTFFKVFKEFTGMTPRAFLKEQKVEETA